MSEYEGSLRMEGDSSPPMGVEIDLTDDRMKVTAGGAEVGDWSRQEVRVQALPDGFHLRVEGEVVILDVSDDARFALDLGLRTAHPALRRRMSALLRDDV
jgi:hypothetical protein